MAVNFDGINIQPSEDTRSKIAAYAVLSRQNIDVVVGQLEGLLNEMLKQKCIELLGGFPEETIPAPTAPVKVPVRAPKPRSFAEASRATETPPPVVEEAFGSVETGDANPPQHELSNDEDTQDNKSLEEQIEEEEPLSPEATAELKRAFQNARFKDAGNNAEAFLEESFDRPGDSDDEIPSVTRGYAGQGPYGERPVKAARSFESRLMKGHRARVSAHTGEED
jgi:hypothetical protein